MKAAACDVADGRFLDCFTPEPVSGSFVLEKPAQYVILKIIQMRQQIVETRDVDYGQE